MVAQITTLAFQGIKARPVTVQAQCSKGLPCFSIVGLGGKAVAESRERIRGAFSSLGLALPGKRITVNLAPADIPKEGAHYDLPIALALMAEMGIFDRYELADYVVMGELGLDASLAPTPGALPAAMRALEWEKGFICPALNGEEAAWAGKVTVLAPQNLTQLVNHFKGEQVLTPAQPGTLNTHPHPFDLHEVKGQEAAKRALEVTAAGGHNLLMTGPPGSGKSMLAARLPGLLPPLTSQEILDVSMIHSLATGVEHGKFTQNRPFRAPHHSASMAAMVGGGMRVRPGEISLAHHGVLFLDELPEFPPQVLDSLRQPMETGEVHIARANAHFTYPASFQLIAAMNPCRCGGGSGGATCSLGPQCRERYQARVSGPIRDRFDLHIEVPAVTPQDLFLPPPKEGSVEVAHRILQAREHQMARKFNGRSYLNAHLDGKALERYAMPDEAGKNLLSRATDQNGLNSQRFLQSFKDCTNHSGYGRWWWCPSISHSRSSELPSICF